MYIITAMIGTSIKVNLRQFWEGARGRKGRKAEGARERVQRGGVSREEVDRGGEGGVKGNR